MQKSPNQQGKP